MQVFETLGRAGIQVLHPQLPLLSHSELGLEIIYVKAPHLADQICSTILAQRPKRVGFDLEYTPSHMWLAEGDGLVATVQIAHAKKAWVFHLSQMKNEGEKRVLPHQLKLLLEDPGILKSGVNIKGDNTHLSKIGIRMPEECLEDVGKVCTNLGLHDTSGSGSLKDLCRKFMGGDLNKACARNYWDGYKAPAGAQSLQDPLIHYAAMDAHVGLVIAETLEKISHGLPSGFKQGDKVLLFDSSLKKRVACAQVSRTSDCNAPGYLLVKLEEIYIPSFVLDSTQAPQQHPTVKTLGDLNSFVNRDSNDSSGGFTILWQQSNTRHFVEVPGTFPTMKPTHTHTHTNTHTLRGRERKCMHTYTLTSVLTYNLSLVHVPHTHVSAPVHA
jgi:hypothetical protein